MHPTLKKNYFVTRSHTLACPPFRTSLLKRRLFLRNWNPFDWHHLKYPPLSNGCENFEVNDPVKVPSHFWFLKFSASATFFIQMLFHLCANTSQNVIRAMTMFSLILAFSSVLPLILYITITSRPTIYHCHKGQSSLFLLPSPQDRLFTTVTKDSPP